MKLMTVKINESIDHILNFESSDDKTPYEFVVESSGNVALLTLIRYQPVFREDNRYLYQTDDDGYGLYLKRFRYAVKPKLQGTSDCKEAVVEVHFTDIDPDMDKKSVKKADNNFDDGWDESTDTFNLSVDNSNLCYRIRFDFTITFKQNNYKRSLVINVAPKTNIYDAVLDFGSEASQILLFHRRNAKITNAPFPIYSGFKKFLGNKEDNDANVLQYDNGTTDLYKSHFFIPKVIDTSIRYNPAETPKNLKLLKQYTLIDKLPEIRKDYITLPNVKIAAYGGVKAPEVTSKEDAPVPVKTFQNNYFYRASVNSFVYQIIEQVADSIQNQFTSSSPQSAFIVLYALVPNIYSQMEVSEYLNFLRADVQSIIQSDDRLKSLIRGVSLTSVSESDASFLGFLSACPAQTNSLEPGEYLIMDAGKGTLDFSVIDYNTKQYPSVRGIYRSGIVGAGNAITYSFLLAVLSHIFAPIESDQAKRDDLIDSFIKNNVHNADEAEVYDMLDKIEQYKRKYNEGVLKNDWIGGTLQRNSKLELIGLINMLKHNLDNNSALSDYSIVEAMMDKIADSAVQKLAYRGTNNIKKVIFTGRGFRLKAFRDVMLAKLRTLGGCENLTDISIDEATVSMKRICLLGLPYLNSGSYDGLMVGEPDILHHGDDILTQHEFKVERKGKAVKRGTSFQKIRETWKALWNASGDGGAMNGEMISVDNNYTNGVRLHAKTIEDKVVISGNFYKLKNLEVGSFDVFFDGDCFWARQDSKLLSFGPVVDVASCMAYESMFPYAEYQSNMKIPIPHLERHANNSSDRVESGTKAKSDDTSNIVADADVIIALTDDELAATLSGRK